MKIKLLLLILIAFTSNCYSQNWEWAKQTGGFDYDDVSGIAADQSGNTYMTGRVGISPIFFLTKYDPTGAVVWTKTPMGFCEPTGVTVDFAGCIFVTGLFRYSMVFDSITLNTQNYFDMFLVKYDPNGNAIWAKKTGGNNTSEGARGLAVTTDPMGNVCVSGLFNTAFLTFDNITVYNQYNNGHLFLAKYNSTGSVLWVKVAGGNYYNGGTTYANSVATDKLGNIYMTGGFDCSSIAFDNQVLTLSNNTPGVTDMFVVKFDGNGNTTWAKSAGNNAGTGAASIAVDQLENVYVAGTFASHIITFGSTTLINPNNPSNNCNGPQYSSDFIVKYDENGNVDWAKRFANNYNTDRAFAITVDIFGSIYMIGGISDSTISTYNMFLVRFDASGNILMTRYAIDHDNYGNSLATDGSGNVYVSGNFMGDSIFLDPYSLNNAGNADMFIAKLHSSPLNVFEEKANSTINIFPNPSSGIFTVTLSKVEGQSSEKSSSVEIFNLLGEKIYSSEAQQQKLTIDLSDKPKGIYFVEIVSAGSRTVKKIVLD